MNKEQTKQQKDLMSILFWGIVIISIVISLIITRSYVNGFHNVDLAYNFKYVEQEFNTTPIDLGSDGKYRTMDELYGKGLEQIRFFYRGMSLFAYIFMMLSVVLAIKYFEIKRENKK